MVMHVFSQITERECVKGRHPQSTANISPILRDNLETVRDGTCASNKLI